MATATAADRRRWNATYRERHPEAAAEANRSYRRRHHARLKAERASRAADINARRRRRYAESPEIRSRAIARARRPTVGRRAEIDARRQEIRAAVLAEFGPDAEPTRAEMMAIYRRRWERADPERVQQLRREGVARRRARRLAVHVEKLDRNAVWHRDGGICGICGEMVSPSDWHLDHVIPLSRGGEHSYANVQVAHPVCNRSKSARLPEAA